MGRVRAVERKPSWLHAMAQSGALAGLTDVVCAGCGRWVLECRDGVWTRWDCTPLRRDDLPMAIIMGVHVARLKRLPGGGIRLLETIGETGLSGDGSTEWLAAHECDRPRLTDHAWKPTPKRKTTWRMTWPKVRQVDGDPWAATIVGKGKKK